MKLAYPNAKSSAAFQIIKGKVMTKETVNADQKIQPAMGSVPKSSSMDAQPIYDLLKADHKIVKTLLEKIESAGKENIAEARALFKEVKLELTAHSEAEQKAFYDPLKKSAKSEDMIFEAEEEHSIVKNLMDEASQTRNSDRFMAKMKVLKELVSHHVKEEENQIFSTSQSIISDEEAEKMGANFQVQKNKIMNLN